jgi:iron(III) transport system permease protein
MAQASASRATLLSRMGARLRPRELFQPRNLIILAVVAVIAYLALVPLGYLLWGTFFDENGFTLKHFSEAYQGIPFSTLVTNSFVFALGSTVLSVTIGTTLAYLHSRTDVPFKRLVFAASLVPLIIPGILHTIAWILLFSPRIGVLNKVVEPVFGPEAFNIFSVQGMILVEGLHLSPLVFLLMTAAFRSMDPSLEESALMSGARMRTVVRRITLPLVRPALVAAILVMMVRVLEASEVAAILGTQARYHVFISRIFDALEGVRPRYGVGGALALSLLAFTMVGVFLQSRMSKRGKAFQTVTGKGFRPRPLPLGRWRWPAAGLILFYFLIAVVLPLLILIYSSTQPFYSAPSWKSLGRASMENYVTTFTRPTSLIALRNSLVLGIGSATAIMFFTAIAAWLVVRTKLRGRWLVDGLAFTPLVIPGLVMGVALLFVYLRFPLPIYGSLWILAIAYFTRYMPYGMRYSSSATYQISGELEESAQTSGASWWQTFRRVHLPLLMPGLIAGWIYILLVSFRELSSSILLYSPGNEVLSILIWEQWENGQFTQLAALGVVMISILVLLVVVASRLGARIGVREH